MLLVDGDVGPAIKRWPNQQGSNLGPVSPATVDDGSIDETVFASLSRHADDQSLIYQGPDGSLTWQDLGRRADQASKVLARGGLKSGDRVALLIPPSPDLLVAAAAVWRCGGVLTVVDPSGGLASIRRLLRAQAPRMVIGTAKTLLGARLFRFTPGSFAAGFGLRGVAIDLNASVDSPLPMVNLRHGDLAAIVHTSGATGPAKAVRYSHGALIAQRDALRSLVQPRPDQVFATSFAAFLLLAPVLEMPCIRPDIPIDQPSELGYDELLNASRGDSIGTAWLSPASARQLVRTAAGRSMSIGRTLLAGAPIPASLARAVKHVTGGVVLAPYGMTECLPITGGEDPELTGPLGGTSVGFPVDGCTVKIVELNDPSQVVADGQWGEVLVSAPWMFDGYDGAWTKTEDSTLALSGISFHRTGDVGYLHEGHLYILGRLAHVLWTKDGPLASVGIEGPLAAALSLEVAAVGVGPDGHELVAVVLNKQGKLRLANSTLALEARRVSTVPLAAVLEGTLPVDHRHQSKVDRALLRQHVSTFLQGR
ncbi:MAG: AMP-binding protein [Actinomycetota bacterium]